MRLLIDHRLVVTTSRFVITDHSKDNTTTKQLLAGYDIEQLFCRHESSQQVDLLSQQVDLFSQQIDSLAQQVDLLSQQVDMSSQRCRHVVTKKST